MSRSPSSGARFGLMAVVAMVTCCALPALISAGVLAATGGVLGNPLILAAAALVLGGAVAYAVRRLRGGQGCAVSDAGAEPAALRDPNPG